MKIFYSVMFKNTGGYIHCEKDIETELSTEEVVNKLSDYLDTLKKQKSLTEILRDIPDEHLRIKEGD